MQVDIVPATDESKERSPQLPSRKIAYSNRDINEEGGPSGGMIVYDNHMANTESDRFVLQSENLRLTKKVTELLNSFALKDSDFNKLLIDRQELKEQMASKDEQIDDLNIVNKETARLLGVETNLIMEFRLALNEWFEGLGFTAAKPDDAKERKAWDKLVRLQGWPEPKARDYRERLAKALGKKKGFL